MDRRLNKKGQSGLDTIFAIAALFGLVLASLIGVYTYNQFLDHAKSSEVMNKSTAAISAMEQSQTNNEIFDYFILVIFIGFALAMIVLGYFIDVSSVFFPLYVIVLIIGVIIATVLNYAWEQIGDSTIFASLKSSTFPIATHIMSNLIIYYIIIGGLALIATYAKTRRERSL